MIFTRQLATLVDSGLPLLRGLNVLAKQERDRVLKNTINKLADGVQSGGTFSESLAQYPVIFNNLYVNMVKAGEVGGVLELVLSRLAEFQEKAAKIKNKVVAAMVYPIIVITLAIAIMGFLLVFIVPKFEQIFHDMLGDKPLPVITLHHQYQQVRAKSLAGPDRRDLSRWSPTNSRTGHRAVEQSSIGLSCSCRCLVMSFAKLLSRGFPARWARS